MVDQKLNVNKLIYHTLYCWLVYSGTNIVNRDFADLHSLVTNIATFFSSTLCTCVCVFVWKRQQVFTAPVLVIRLNRCFPRG